MIFLPLHPWRSGKRPTMEDAHAIHLDLHATVHQSVVPLEGGVFVVFVRLLCLGFVCLFCLSVLCVCYIFCVLCMCVVRCACVFRVVVCVVCAPTLLLPSSQPGGKHHHHLTTELASRVDANLLGGLSRCAKEFATGGSLKTS